MVERVGVAKSTYLRIEKGDPTVSLGAYAMTFFALGFGTALGQVLDAGDDDEDLLLEATALPKRVRARKST